MLNAESITDANEIDQELDALPQAQGFFRPGMGKALVHAEKRGPAFDGIENRPLSAALAQSLQAQGLAACGHVLSALDRKSLPDLATAWAHLVAVLRLEFQPIDIVVGPWWGEDPWSRLTASVREAMCHAGQPGALVKWVGVDAAVQAWIRQERG
jgi:hypothetical protein